MICAAVAATRINNPGFAVGAQFGNASTKNVSHVCDEFPCATISMMPLSAEKKLILRAVAAWRDLGTDAFLQQEEKRYSCPACHQILSRGATECSHCHSLVIIDS
jgi:hypothetical protein